MVATSARSGWDGPSSSVATIGESKSIEVTFGYLETVPEISLQERWNVFLMRVTLAPNYPRFSPHPGPPVPLIDQLMAGGLYVDMVSILDAGLKRHLRANGNPAANGKLYSKIEAVKDGHPLPDVTTLHSIRDRRNDLAHEAELTMTWPELDRAIEAVGEALIALGVIVSTPEFTYASEFGSSTTGVNTVGVQWPNGKWAMKYSWTRTPLRH